MKIIPPKPFAVDLEFSEYDKNTITNMYHLLTELREAMSEYNLEIETSDGYITDSILSGTQGLLMHLLKADKLSRKY